MVGESRGRAESGVKYVPRVRLRRTEWRGPCRPTFGLEGSMGIKALSTLHYQDGREY